MAYSCCLFSVIGNHNPDIVILATAILCCVCSFYTCPIIPFIVILRLRIYIAVKCGLDEARVNYCQVVYNSRTVR